MKSFPKRKLDTMFEYSKDLLRGRGGGGGGGGGGIVHVEDSSLYNRKSVVWCNEAVSRVVTIMYNSAYLARFSQNQGYPHTRLVLTTTWDSDALI
ncbi:hypothetical protein M0804_009373 [Polistes exclamans]|nr:hypothetical protein M0804_009373 [Polistes exclamans]